LLAPWIGRVTFGAVAFLGRAAQLVVLAVAAGGAPALAAYQQRPNGEWVHLAPEFSEEPKA